MKAAPSAIWGAAIGIAVAADLYADSKHNGSTLSECTRALFHTDTLAGQIAFGAFWGGFAAWVLPHINTEGRSRCGS